MCPLRNHNRKEPDLLPRPSQERGPGIPGSHEDRVLDPSGAPLLAVIGPTGTGKTALAIELAETLGGELIGCDALQIYRRLDVGTAKPSAEDRARVELLDEDELAW